MSKAAPALSSKPITAPPTLPRDPWRWSVVIVVLFALVAGIRLSIPSHPYFDEVHYLPAARDLLAMWQGEDAAYSNREHPLLGKVLIALGIAAFGDDPVGWRAPSLIAGTIALAASMRALWHASADRFATLSFGLLLASGFTLFIHARIAMLDIFMIAFLALACWQFAAAIREPETGRWRLILTGIAIGCAIASKWNAVPLAMIFGLGFFAARLSAGRRRLFTSRRGVPVPGVSLIEAFAWLGVVPLAIYGLSFVPGFWLSAPLQPSPLAEGGLIGLHAQMFALQQQVVTPHAYQSAWAQWVLNTRGVWYLYEHVDGAQRGVLLIGNPLTMLLGLPALIWCAGIGLYRSDWARLAVVVGYCVTLGFWLIAPKPVQFYYHYAVPSVFLLAALALVLSDLRASGREALAWTVVAASGAVFAVFFKITAAAPLDGPMSFADWTWLAGWR
ncbi:MAG: phospholipid carrier-dependent glycosyltransferase [Erythrobacter sp.]|jgi:dolichyl-phosphate-mannose--protein O-mannosyl transferase|nr:phospholipid carrier-dependent glycosyltransferase [Erythrobacter sp.]